MKKQANFSLLVYVIFLVALYFVGTSVLAPANNVLGEKSFLFFLIAIIIGFIFDVIIMEVGHIIGALIGGYRIVSVSFMWLTFRKEKGKLKILLSSFEGFTGETRIAPKKDNANPMPYFWGGTILLLIILVFGVYFPALLNPEMNSDMRTYLKYGSYVISVVAGLLLIYNIIPLQLDTKNDAMMMKQVTKNNVDIFNKICLLQEKLINGEALEIDETIIEIDYITAQWNYYVYLSKTYQGKYQEAEAIIDQFIENSEKLPENIYQELISAKLFLLLFGKGKDTAVEYFKSLSQNERKLIVETNSIEGTRNYFAIQALLIENKEDSESAHKKYRSQVKAVVEKGRQFDEEQLMGEIINRIHEQHPEWKY